MLARSDAVRNRSGRHRLRHQLDPPPGGRCRGPAARTADAHHAARPGGGRHGAPGSRGDRPVRRRPRRVPPGHGPSRRRPGAPGRHVGRTGRSQWRRVPAAGRRGHRSRTRAAQRRRRGAALTDGSGGRPRFVRRPVPGPRHRRRIDGAGRRRRSGRPGAGRRVAAARLCARVGAVPGRGSTDCGPAGIRPPRGGRPTRPGGGRPPAVQHRPSTRRPGRNREHAGVGAPGSGPLRPGPRPPRRPVRRRRPAVVRGVGGGHGGGAPRPSGHGGGTSGRDRGRRPHPRRGDDAPRIRRVPRLRGGHPGRPGGQSAGRGLVGPCGIGRPSDATADVHVG